MSRFIDHHRATFGVEPICQALGIAPSSYYAARRRPPSLRARRDAQLRPAIRRVHAANYGVYGVRKVWAALAREGTVVGRDRVARLMRELGLRGVSRERRTVTTLPAAVTDRPGDLVERSFRAAAPNRLWLADITYVPLSSGGFCYSAFITDAFARRIVGWRVASTLRTDLALDALEMALFARRVRLPNLVHHSDRGIQYLALRYTERLVEAGAARSVGSRGDSYDNALAESVNSLYKAELIRRHSWRTTADVERATGAWVGWWNEVRLHGACGNIPPAEFEAAYDHRATAAVPHEAA
jgi:putative transposase